jgi:transcriptional regulator with XRE-family HTH domain
MNFQQLEARFLEDLRRRIRSGELTECQLARLSGISQPHVHNVLKGKRLLSMELADTILHVLRLDLLDMIRPDDPCDEIGRGQ